MNNNQKQNTQLRKYGLVIGIIAMVALVGWYMDRRSTEQKIIGMVEQGMSNNRGFGRDEVRFSSQEFQQLMTKTREESYAKGKLKAIEEGKAIAAEEIATKMLLEGIEVNKARNISGVGLIKMRDITKKIWPDGKQPLPSEPQGQ